VSDNNFVGSLATTLGDVVQDIDVNFNYSNLTGDVDIMTAKFNIEVKSGTSPKFTQSLKNAEYAKSQGKGYILYMPKATKSQVRVANEKGITLIRTVENLKKAIQ